jgi:DNA polymerase elongation subunit (family B)
MTNNFETIVIDTTNDVGILTINRPSKLNALNIQVHRELKECLIELHNAKLKGLILIGEGEKIKFIYLKEPNTIKENCIGFIGELPAELGLTSYIDYDTMWDKSFIEPLNGIIEGLGWTTSPQASLDDLFA